jgi:hypothetical protein
MKGAERSSIRNALACAALIITTCSCTSEESPTRSERISALALKASPAAYALFQRELDDVKADNDFGKRAKDPKNYEVYITEDADAFLFTFVMRHAKNERILDGRSVYAVSKKDGSATVRSIL